MRTLYAWLIANVESVTTFLVLLAFVIYLFTSHALTMGVGDKIGIFLLGGIVITSGKTLMGGIPSKGILTDIINLIIIVAIYVVLFIICFAGYGKEPLLEKMLYMILGIGIVSLLLSIMAALFTYRNMSEVVSRRMLYVNSRVDIFEITWMYTLNRFVATFSGISSLGLIVIVGKMLADKAIEMGGI